MPNFRDTFQIDGVRKTADGYMVAQARVARTGIQVYAGYEVGKPEMASVRVYRPADEVFSKDAMRSFAHRPVTLDHPTVPVDASNWRDHARGTTGDEIVRDGDFIRVPLMLTDAATIDAVEGGKRELSMGYAAELDFTSGFTDNGEEYDAVQRNIRANHLAVVTVARGGSKLRIGDQGNQPMTTKTIMIDGLPFQVDDTAANIITKLQNDAAKVAASHDAAVAKLTADHAAVIAAKDAEIDALKAKTISDADLDARVSARASLVATAGKLAPAFKCDGLSDADIRKGVVLAVVGDSVKDKPAAYIDARFDILAEDAAKTGATDSGRNAISALDGATGFADAEKQEREAYTASIARFDRNKGKAA